MGILTANAPQSAQCLGGAMSSDLPGRDADVEALSGPPEAWEPWETQLVLGSLVLGLIGLLVLGWLVNRFILP